MSNDYQDPAQQQNPNQQPQQQGNPNQPSQQQNPQGGSAQQQGQGNPAQLEAAKHMAEQQLDQVIDQFAQKIPGGTAHAQQAKDAAAGLLDNLEKEAEQHMGDVGGMLGGLFGHHKDKPSSQG